MSDIFDEIAERAWARAEGDQQVSAGRLDHECIPASTYAAVFREHFGKGIDEALMWLQAKCRHRDTFHRVDAAEHVLSKLIGQKPENPDPD